MLLIVSFRDHAEKEEKYTLFSYH